MAEPASPDRLLTPTFVAPAVGTLVLVAAFRARPAATSAATLTR
jgi:hypothetical protein